MEFFINDKPTVPDEQLMLSIVIPAYNESLRLPKTLESIREFLADREYEVLVVDD